MGGGEGEEVVPPSYDANTHSSLRVLERILPVRWRRRSMCWLRSMLGLLARRGSSGMDLLGMLDVGFEGCCCGTIGVLWRFLR